MTTEERIAVGVSIAEGPGLIAGDDYAEALARLAHASDLECRLTTDRAIAIEALAEARAANGLAAGLMMILLDRELLKADELSSVLEVSMITEIQRVVQRVEQRFGVRVKV